MSKLKRTGHDFEKIVCEILKRNKCFTVTQTKKVGDGGIDFYLTSMGTVVAGEIKSGKSIIGSPVLRTFFGALSAHQIKHGLFISFCKISPDAVKFVKSIGPEFNFIAAQINETKIPCATSLSDAVVRIHRNPFPINDLNTLHISNKTLNLHGKLV